MSDTQIIIKCDDIVSNKDGVSEALADMLYSSPEQQHSAVAVLRALVEKMGQPKTPRPPSASSRVGGLEAYLDTQLVWHWVQDGWRAFGLVEIIDGAQAKRSADEFKRGANSFYIKLNKQDLLKFRDKLTEMIEIWEKHEPAKEDAP